MECQCWKNAASNTAMQCSERYIQSHEEVDCNDVHDTALWYRALIYSTEHYCTLVNSTLLCILLCGALH